MILPDLINNGSIPNNFFRPGHLSGGVMHHWFIALTLIQIP